MTKAALGHEEVGIIKPIIFYQKKRIFQSNRTSGLHQPCVDHGMARCARMRIPILIILHHVNRDLSGATSPKAVILQWGLAYKKVVGFPGAIVIIGSGTACEITALVMIQSVFLRIEKAGLVLSEYYSIVFHSIVPSGDAQIDLPRILSRVSFNFLYRSWWN